MEVKEDECMMIDCPLEPLRRRHTHRYNRCAAGLALSILLSTGGPLCGEGTADLDSGKSGSDVFKEDSANASRPPATLANKPPVNASLAAKTATSDAGVPKKRLPAPSAADDAAARKLVHQTFKDEYAKTKPEGRAALIALLLKTEPQGGTPVERYAMLREAIDLAGSAGNVQAIRRAGDKLTATFFVQFPAATLPAYAAAAKVIRDPAGARLLAEAALRMSDMAGEGDDADFTIALKAAGIAEAAAKLSRDTALIVRTKNQSKAATDQQRQYVKIAALEKKLILTPDDPEMNRQVGSFYCFVANAWTRGLPLLAKGSDASLKALAELELKSPASPGDQNKVADAWWDLAERNKGRDKKTEDAARRRAGDWYSKAESKLTGGEQTKARIRLGAINAANLRPSKRIDLLAMTRLPEAGLSGKWTKGEEDGAFVTDKATFSRVQFPYEPPAEYDLEAEFTLLASNNTVPEGGIVVLILPVPAKPGEFFEWYMTPKTAGFESLPGESAGALKAGVLHANMMIVNQKSTAIVKVRRTGIQGYINGQVAVELDADRAGTLKGFKGWGLTNRAALGVGAYSVPVAFQRVEVVEKSGAGKVVGE